MSEKISVLIAENHGLVRAGFKAIISASDDIQVVADSGDGLQCLELIRLHTPKVLLLDLPMTTLSGINLIGHVKKHYPQTKILVLTAAQSLSVWREVLDLGVQGLATKSISLNELDNGIRDVAKGHLFIHSEVLPKIEASDGFKNKRLSVREKQVVKLVAEGLKTKEIADKLGISDRTVSKHRENLMTKMGASASSELVTYANETGLTKIMLEEIQ